MQHVLMDLDDVGFRQEALDAAMGHHYLTLICAQLSEDVQQFLMGRIEGAFPFKELDELPAIYKITMNITIIKCKIVSFLNILAKHFYMNHSEVVTQMVKEFATTHQHLSCVRKWNSVFHVNSINSYGHNGSSYWQVISSHGQNKFKISLEKLTAFLIWGLILPSSL